MRRCHKFSLSHEREIERERIHLQKREKGENGRIFFCPLPLRVHKHVTKRAKVETRDRHDRQRARSKGKWRRCHER